MERRKIKKSKLVWLSLLLVFVTVCSVAAGMTFRTNASDRYFSGEAEVYFQGLMKEGFPESYATALTELHLLHPEWNFTPLLITRQKSSYTWNYVVGEECKSDNKGTEPRNLISASDAYAAYRDPGNSKKYDSDKYQASREAVAYFMDPRNFLNEADIFQFLDLSVADQMTGQLVETVLSGTFMENCVLENGKTYAENFAECGSRIGINPVFLAVKARQEQGVRGTSQVLTGKAGTLLWDYYRNGTQVSSSGNSVLAPSEGFTEEELLALDGYYNLYNVSASGNGLFRIYYNAMKKAREGTPAFAAEWEDSPSWNTIWKSLYGGAYLLKTRYIDRFQPTVYLQKFNVDSRAGDRNFWGQYMQNVSGALTEGRNFYTAFAEADVLDHAYTFLIPVYAGMPSEASHDPANGQCEYLSPATSRFSYTVTVSAPFHASSSSSPLYLEQELRPGNRLSIGGAVSHDYGVRGLEYRWDAGDWVSCAENGALKLSLPADFSEGSSHILVIRGNAAFGDRQKSNRHFLCAVIYVRITAPKTAKLTIATGETRQEMNLLTGTAFSLPVCKDSGFAGWLSSAGAFLPSGGSDILERDTVYTARFCQLRTLAGASVSLHGAARLRFYAVPDPDSLTLFRQFPANVSFFAFAKDREIPVKVSGEDPFLLVADVAVTDPLATYDVRFGIRLRYSDGTTSVILSEESSGARSAAAVAELALADETAALSDSEVSYLRQLLQTSPSH